MHILILNQYYPPDTSATAPIIRDVAHALAERHKVTILCGRPSYAPAEHHPYYLLRSVVEDRGVRTDRVGSTAFHRRNKLGRLLNYITYLSLGLLRALTLRPRPDVIIAMTDPPVVAMVGAFAAAVRRSRFVYNIRDLHPDMALAAGIRIPGFIATIWEGLHRWALRRARPVIVLGEDMGDRVLAKGVPADRVVVVRDGAWPLAKTYSENRDVVTKIRGDSTFVLLHAGNLGFAGDWETLIHAAKLLEKDGVALTFVGDGARRKELEAKARGVGNVRFLPFFPANQLPSVLAAPDMHIVAVRPGLEGLVVPSKLYPILLAGKPVLVASSEKSDAARIVAKSGCGLVVPADDADAIAGAVRSLIGRPDQLDLMGTRARGVSESFLRDKELSSFVSYIEKSGDLHFASTAPKGASVKE